MDPQHGRGDEGVDASSKNFQVPVKMRQMAAVVDKYQQTNMELVQKLRETLQLCRLLKSEIEQLRKENFKLVMDLNCSFHSMLSDEGEDFWSWRAWKLNFIL